MEEFSQIQICLASPVGPDGFEFINKDFQRAEVVHGDIAVALPNLSVSIEVGTIANSVISIGAKTLEHSKSTGKACMFSALMRGDKTRSPKEHAWKDVDKKMDVFVWGTHFVLSSLGEKHNVLHCIVLLLFLLSCVLVHT